MSNPTLLSYNSIVQDSVGQVIPGSTIIVLAGTVDGSRAVNSATKPGTPLANIFYDAYGAFPINQITTPLLADGNGNFQFWAAPGWYVLQIYGAGVQGQFVQGLSIGLGLGNSVLGNGTTVIDTTTMPGADMGARLQAAQTAICSSYTEGTIDTRGEIDPNTHKPGGSSSVSLEIGQIITGSSTCKIHLLMYGALAMGAGKGVSLHSGSSIEGYSADVSSITTDGTVPAISNAYEFGGISDIQIHGVATFSSATVAPPSFSVTSVVAADANGDTQYNFTADPTLTPNRYRGYWFRVTGSLASTNKTGGANPAFFLCDGNTSSSLKLQNPSGTTQTANGTATTSGVAGLLLGGPRDAVTMPALEAVTRTQNALGWDFYDTPFSGSLAHIHLYASALTPTQIADDYAAGETVGTGYKSFVLGTSPLAYWELNEASGPTAVEQVAGLNGTYANTGDITFGSQAQIPGDAGHTAPIYGGTNGYVSIPSHTWFNSANWTIIAWAKATKLVSQQALMSFSTGEFSNEIVVSDSTDVPGLVIDIIPPSGNDFRMTDPQYELCATAACVGATWQQVAIVYNNGQMTLFENGVKARIGVDVSGNNTLISQIISGGFDVGVELNGQRGCTCYNTLGDISASGSKAIGVNLINNSGFGFGVNDNKIQGVQANTVPVGLFNGAAGTRNRIKDDSYEGNTIFGRWMAGYHDFYLSPYEEGGGSNDYICGSFQYVEHPMATGGSTYTPVICSGPTTVSGGPLSNLIVGPSATPASWGVKNTIFFGNNHYDDCNSDTVGINSDGPQWACFTRKVSGTAGHSTWESGLSKYHSGAINTGLTSLSKLTNPVAPTVTSVGGSGTTRNYGLVCLDSNGGSTAEGAFTALTNNGPATLGAILTLAVSAGGTGYTQGNVGSTFTVNDLNYGGTGGVGTISEVNGGSGTGPVTGVTLTTPGSKYVQLPFPGSGVNNVFPTTGGAGTGLTVAITSSYMLVTFPTQDGCASWVVLDDSTHQITINVNGSTDRSANLAIFNIAHSGYAAVRNSTGDSSLAGYLDLGDEIEANLGSPPNGTMVYCSDCLNVVDDSASPGALCAGSGHGAVARRENGHWACN